MIVFDSIKNSLWNGTGFNLDNKKIKCLQLAFLDQKIILKSGEHQIKINGKRNSGNGAFKVEFLEKDIIIFEKKFNFINNNNSTLICNFNIINSGIYKIKISRDSSSIGTINIDSIRVIHTQELISHLSVQSPNNISSIKIKKEENPIINNDFENYKKIYLIDDLNNKSEKIEDFIKENNLNIKNSKILNLYSESFYNKKYNTLIDKRVFESSNLLSEFLEINDPDLIVIFSDDEKICSIKDSLNLNFLIINSKIDQSLKIRSDKKSFKSSSFLFEGVLL